MKLLDKFSAFIRILKESLRIMSNSFKWFFYTSILYVVKYNYRNSHAQSCLLKGYLSSEGFIQRLVFTMTD